MRYRNLLTVHSIVTAVSTIALLGFVVGPAQAADPAVGCESGKLKIAGKYASCLLSADSKAAKTGDPADYSTCVSKFGASWQKAEDKGAGMCPGGSGDQTDVQTFLDGCTQSVADALAASDTLPVPGGVGRTFTDNGDGTITDDVTGLMWEKRSDDGTIHDWDNVYTWSDAAAVKVATLNSTSFGGHNDWRVPDRFELETLVNAVTWDPATYPAFSSGCTPGCAIAICNCTAPYPYWSSTTEASGGPVPSAWVVSFLNGFVDYNGQYNSWLVRAVRGGS
jgi:hypothetical protein